MDASWELQLSRLRNSPAYRGLLVNGHIREQPITPRQRFYNSPGDFVIDGADLWDVNYTAGSTHSFSTPVYTTCYDKIRMIPAYRQFGRALGLSPSDVIFLLTPVGAKPHVAETRILYLSQTCGCPVIQANLGSQLKAGGVDTSPNSLVERAKASRCSVLLGFPALIRRFLELVRDTGLIFPLRYVLSGGERLSTHDRRHLEELAASISNGPCSVRQIFMSTEMQIPFYECTPGGGLHCSDPTYLHTEIVNDQGEAVTPGESGQLLITHLDRTGTSLLRYATGDYCVLANGTCQVCGQPLVFMPFADGSYVRRAPDRVKVKGQMVSLIYLEQKLKNEFSHQVRVEVHGGKELVIKMPRNLERDAEEARKLVKAWVDVTPTIVTDDPGGLKGVGL